MRWFLAPSVFFLGVCFWGPSFATTLGPLHSHNDYAQSRALDLALAHGFSSVEADIWHWEGDLQVGHLPLIFKGTLRELYLTPLLFRVLKNGGSVHGDGQPFYLWIEFKDASLEAVDLLKKELELFPIFTEFTDRGIRWRAVTVILTGNEKNKERFVSLPGRRFATRDSEWISSSDPGADIVSQNQWLWYSLDWKRFFRWNGRGKMSSAEKADLRRLLDEARSLGRRVRFFNAPDRWPFWQLARAEGFDLVGTDRIEALARYWIGGPTSAGRRSLPAVTSFSNESLQTLDRLHR
ncbi:MAG: hypothetical protein KGQ59_03075 [Bdellovibrionales bacterium]|nr:hypothetical protein [Bdellovibrionales bacterium]